MSTDRDVTRIVRSWLHEDAHEDADRILNLVLDEIDTTPQRRAGWLARRAPRMNNALKIVLAAAAVVVVAVAVINFLPRDGGVGGPDVASPSPTPGPSYEATRLTVAGSEAPGPALSLTVGLPEGWTAFTYGADRGGSAPPDGMAFIVTLVSDTFQDPCSQVPRDPQIGPTVEDLAAALSEIPSTSARDPVQTTIAGLDATYIEVAIPASLPCDPSQFYLVQDSPEGAWWAQGLNETARFWILDVAGQRVAILAHTYPGSGADANSELDNILNSIVFDVAS
jgi:hypothetical protein